MNSVSFKFNKAVETVLKHEGGYVNNPNDLGGETNFGISKKSYPNLDIKNLTKDDAIAIYKRDFWDKYGYEDIGPEKIYTKIFDMAVCMGPHMAHLLIQRALWACNSPVNEDGILGIITKEAINNAVTSALQAAYKAEIAARFRFLANERKENKVFLKGWLKRAYA